MKTLKLSWIFAAAAVAVTAGSASAQTYKAEIPMSFHLGNKAMTPGAYEISVNRFAGSGQAYVMVHNVRSNSLVTLLPITEIEVPERRQEEGTAKIVFECVGSTCTLRQLWTGRDLTAYTFPAHKLPAAEVERVAAVTVVLTKAD